MFSVDVLTSVNGNITYIRPHLNPACNYLLVCRNGKQILKLIYLVVLENCIFQLAIGKYINPSCYRQIIETESIEKLDTPEPANLLEDQKHTSAVAKMHYQKRKPENTAKANKSWIKVRDRSGSSNVNSNEIRYRKQR